MPETQSIWTTAFEAFGGGPGAVAILALGFLAWTLLNWWKATQESRIQDHKDHAEASRQMTKEVVEGLNASAAAVRELTREVTR